jgi:hypothetical protein
MFRSPFKRNLSGEGNLEAVWIAQSAMSLHLLEAAGNPKTQNRRLASRNPNSQKPPSKPFFGTIQGAHRPIRAITHDYPVPDFLIE